MRATRRFWGLGAAATGLAVLAVVVQNPLYLWGTAAIAGWVVAGQLAFLVDLQATLSACTVDQFAAPDRVLEARPTAITATGQFDRSPWNTCELAVRPPLAMDAQHATETVDGGAVNVTVEGGFQVAGQYEVQRPELTARDPLGLFVETVPVGPATRVVVEPSAPNDAVVLSDGDRISIGYGAHDADTGTTGFVSGELREYVPGDPSNRIDWKATARTGDAYVREADPETDRKITLVVDHRRSLAEGTDGQTQLDYIREVALWLVDHADSLSDPLAVRTVGDAGTTTELDATASHNHYRRVRKLLYDLRPTRQAATADQYAASEHRSVDGESTFDETLGPFFDARNTYVQRVDTDPLFAAVKSLLGARSSSSSIAILTDDSHRAELLEAVKLAGHQQVQLSVFLCADALFANEGVTDLESAYGDYRDFRSFYSMLATHDTVTVHEIGPSKRIDAVIAGGAADRQGRGSMQ